MIRKAVPGDIPAVAAIYDASTTARRQARARPAGSAAYTPPKRRRARRWRRTSCSWTSARDGSSPPRAFDQAQVPEYALARWQYAAEAREIMVLHTLVVDPDAAGQGIGTGFVAFYERYARERGCPCLRMDTNEINAPARALYKRLGYREAGIVPCDFHGLGQIRLVCLEKRLGAVNQPQPLSPDASRPAR